MQNKREFGLIINNTSAYSKPQKQSIKTFVKNITSDSSDEDELNKSDYKSIINRSINKQQDYNSKKISEELSNNIMKDPNIYEYDAIYDDFDKKKNGIRNKSNILNDSVDNSKPRYLNAILEAAEKRKIEQSITREKVEKKRREREQGEYGDKQKFVTKSYEEALKLQKKKEIELSNKEKKNTINTDYGMMGFYSNLLTKNTAMGAKSKEDEERELLKIYQNKKKDYERTIRKDDDDVEDKKRNNKTDGLDKGKIIPSEELIKNEIKKLKIVEGNIIEKNINQMGIVDQDESNNSKEDLKEKNNIEELKIRYLERKRQREEKRE